MSLPTATDRGSHGARRSRLRDQDFPPRRGRLLAYESAHSKIMALLAVIYLYALQNCTQQTRLSMLLVCIWMFVYRLIISMHAQQAFVQLNRHTPLPFSTSLSYALLFTFFPFRPLYCTGQSTCTQTNRVYAWVVTNPIWEHYDLLQAALTCNSFHFNPMPGMGRLTGSPPPTQSFFRHRAAFFSLPHPEPFFPPLLRPLQSMTLSFVQTFAFLYLRVPEDRRPLNASFTPHGEANLPAGPQDYRRADGLDRFRHSYTLHLHS
ncbi:hypothetical protein EV426DRAFT_366688 [Tirmania nivea]|nr:hypothetical protein EV426DRAFT_366688 [Tirmania nivea]